MEQKEHIVAPQIELKITLPIKKKYIVVEKKPVIKTKPKVEKSLPSPIKLVSKKLDTLQKIKKGIKTAENFTLPKNPQITELLDLNVLPFSTHVVDDVVSGNLLVPGLILSGNPHEWKSNDLSNNDFKEKYFAKLMVVSFNLGHKHGKFKSDKYWNVAGNIHVGRVKQVLHDEIEKFRSSLRDGQFFIPMKTSPHGNVIEEAKKNVSKFLQTLEMTAKDKKTYLSNEDKQKVKHWGGEKMLQAIHHNH